MSSPSIEVRSLQDRDRDWFLSTLNATWGSVHVARRGELIDASQFPGYVASMGGERVGLAVIATREGECEVLSLSVTFLRRGVGRALMHRCFDEARSSECERVWLTTTNDNIAAYAFYQHVGMTLCALRCHGVAAARRLKPTIPLTGQEGLPINHELEFELRLT